MTASDRRQLRLKMHRVGDALLNDVASEQGIDLIPVDELFRSVAFPRPQRIDGAFQVPCLGSLPGRQVGDLSRPGAPYPALGARGPVSYTHLTLPTIYSV